MSLYLGDNIKISESEFFFLGVIQPTSFKLVVDSGELTLNLVSDFLFKGDSENISFPISFLFFIKKFI